MTTNYYITMYCKVQISCHKCSMRAKICDTVFCTNMTNIILQKVLHTLGLDCCTTAAHYDISKYTSSSSSP